MARETTRIETRQTARETSRETTKETARETTRETARFNTRETTIQTAETTRIETRQTARETTRETASFETRETTRQMTIAETTESTKIDRYKEIQVRRRRSRECKPKAIRLCCDEGEREHLICGRITSRHARKHSLPDARGGNTPDSD
ncbi:hypothetical protein YC2023_062056 [Brassica napus]